MRGWGSRWRRGKKDDEREREIDLGRGEGKKREGQRGGLGMARGEVARDAPKVDTLPVVNEWERGRVGERES